MSCDLNLAQASSERKSQSSIQNQFNQWTTSAGFYLSKYIAAFSLIYKKKLHQKEKKKKINFINFNLLLDRRIDGRVFFNRTERQIQRDTPIRPNAEKPETVRNRSDCHLALNRHYESQHLRNQRQKLSGKRSKCTPAVEKHTTELTNKCRSGNSNLFALSGLRQLLLWFGIL